MEEIKEVDIQKEDPLNTKKVNQAAYMFSKLIELIKPGIDGLSQKGLKRLLLTVVEYPFVTNKKNLSPKEQELMTYILLAYENKAVMSEALKLSQEELEKQVIEPITEEVKEKLSNE